MQTIKTAGFFAVILVTFLTLAVSCEKEEAPKYSIVGEWRCVESRETFTFPANGVISYRDEGDGWASWEKYRITANGDSIQFINAREVRYDDGRSYVCSADVLCSKIHFYTNDSLFIEKIPRYADGENSRNLVRIKK